jgi:hypothetical protein
MDFELREEQKAMRLAKRMWMLSAVQLPRGALPIKVGAKVLVPQ